MFKHYFLVGSLLLTTMVYAAAPQQYVAAEPGVIAPASQNVINNTTPSSVPAVANSPLVINQEAGVAHSIPPQTAPSAPVAASAAAAAPSTIALPQGGAPAQPNIANAAPPQFTDADKQIWFNNCVAGAKSKKAQMYAQDFCECGWRHISSGELPVNLLDTNDPNLIKDRDTRMRVISQQCGVELLSRMRQQ